MMLSSGYSKPIAIQAFAETSPQFNESYFVAKQGIQLTQAFATYGVMYKIQPHVFAVVDKIANLIARLGVTVWDTRPDNGDIRDTTGPYAKLMRNPCPTVDRFTFYHWLSTTYEIYGEAYLLKQRTAAAGPVTGLIPMHPAVTQIRRSESGSLLYQFAGLPDMSFAESEVVPFRRYSPDNTMRGLSRLEPLRDTLANEDGARRASNAWWTNLGRPSMVLQSKKKLGTAGRANLLAGYRASIAGAENAGGIMLLEDEVSATKMQLDAEEMQYIGSRKLNRGEVCMVYDIDPEVIQIIDQLTSQQGTGGKFKDVYKSSIDFRLKAFESVFDYHVGGDFGGDREMRYNVSQQLRGDVETLAPAAVQLVQSAIAKPSEVREWFDFDDAGPIADELYANQALQQLNALVDKAKAEIEQAKKPDPAPQVSGELPVSPTATNTESPSVTGDLPKQVPALTDKAMKYRNDIFAGLGRGREWDEVAAKLIERNPLDRKDIQIACLHILTGG
jgi:HK97 family phage portal protein